MEPFKEANASKKEQSRHTDSRSADSSSTRKKKNAHTHTDRRQSKDDVA